MTDKEISMGQVIDMIVQSAEEKGVASKTSTEYKMYRIGDNEVMLTVTCDKKGIPISAACHKGRDFYFFNNQEQAKRLNDACEKKIKAQNEEQAKKDEYLKSKAAYEKEKQRLKMFEKRHNIIVK